MVFKDMPGVKILRLFRAFRVFRLFKRLPSLRKIITGVLKSLPGVSNAFVLLGLFMALFSIMGTDWLGEDFEDYFGSFGRAMLSMFQVMTFDSWSSGIARPICLEKGWFFAIFFFFYVFINGIVMTQVVVAILLDTYLSATADEEPEEGQGEEAAPSRGGIGASRASLGGMMTERFAFALEQQKLKSE